MPQIVELPGNREVEFPDGMSMDDISREIANAFPDLTQDVRPSIAIPEPGTKSPRMASRGVNEVTQAFPVEPEQAPAQEPLLSPLTHEDLVSAVRQEPPPEPEPIKLPNIGEPGTRIGEASRVITGLGEWALNRPEEFILTLHPIGQAALTVRYGPEIAKTIIEDTPKALSGDPGAQGRLGALGALILGPGGAKRAKAEWMLRGKSREQPIVPEEVARQAAKPGQPDMVVEPVTLVKEILKQQPEVPVSHEVVLPGASEIFKTTTESKPTEKGVENAIPQREAEKVSLGEPPGNREEVGAQVREQTPSEVPKEAEIVPPDLQAEARADLEDFVGAKESQPGAVSTPGPGLAPVPAGTTTLPIKGQHEIIQDLAKGLDLPIRFGRLTTSKFAGYFKSIANLIGSKKAVDIPVVSHEVGHKLDSSFGLSSDPTIRPELEVLGDPATAGSRSSWTKSKSLAYKHGEGMAEFVRYWLTDPSQAKTKAPNTFTAFEKALDANKDYGDVMRRAQNDIYLWRNAPSQARLRSHISVGENPNGTPYGLRQLTRDLVDNLHYARLAMDDAAKMAGREFAPTENIYILARLLRGGYGRANTFIRSGVVDFKTKDVTLGTGLEDALKPVAGRLDDFKDWIISKRARELHDKGMETGLVDSDVNSIISRFNSDAAFQDAFTKVKAWNDALLQYAEDSGFVSSDGAKAMRDKWDDYVPFERLFEIGAGELPAEQAMGVGRGLNLGKPGSFKAIHGSSRPIVDPLETMVKNAYVITTAAEKHWLHTKLADLSESPGMGKWIEKIAVPKEVEKVTLAKIRDQLEAQGIDTTGVPDQLMLTFYQNSHRAPYGENIIRIARNGKGEFYRLNKELYETFHGLDLEDSGTLLRILAMPANVLRAGVTVAPDFALANAIRDGFSSSIVSKYGLLPFEATIRGVAAMFRNPKLVSEWAAAGGKNSIEANYFDRTAIQKFVKDKISKDFTPMERALVVGKSPLVALRFLASISEEATRIGEYQVAYNKLIKSGMSEGDAKTLAAFESRDRQDFAKGGAKTKIIRHAAAFWNAGLQANVKLAQAFKERPLETTLKGLAFITTAKMMEQYVNYDDEDYWDRPQWERDLFFLIPFGKDANNKTKFIRIPTPFEPGIIFGTLPGRMVQYMKENDPEAFREFFSTAFKQTVPNPTPQSLQVVYETFLTGKQGWNVYRGKPIVPDPLANAAADMQWTEQTSLTAKKLGALLGFSPMKIDHIISQTSGGLGKQITHNMVDVAISASTGEPRTAKGMIPGGRFVTTPAGVSSEAIERFYENLSRVEGEKLRAKSGADAKDWTALDAGFRKAASEMADLRKAARASTNYVEKQAYYIEIASIAKDMNKIAKEQKVGK